MTALPSLQDLPDRLIHALPLGPHGRAARRVWVGNGHAHIEVRGLHHAAGIHEAVTNSLSHRRGVNWVDLIVAVERVVVAFDEQQVSLQDLVEIVEDVERAFGVSKERFSVDDGEHPSDSSTLQRQVTALASDLVGIGVGAAARVWKVPKVPAEVAAILPFVDAHPRLRGLVARVVGAPAADLGLALGNAVAQAVAQGPLGLVVDAAHRANLARESTARRRAWEKREPDLSRFRGPSPQASSLPQFEAEHDSGLPGERPIPLPRGPIEKAADASGIASVAAFGATLAATRQPRKAAAIGLGTAPKAGRLGREAFSAQVSASLADRGAVPMDPRSLRLLDRIDTVVVEASCFTTGRSVIGEVVPTAPSGEHAQRRPSADVLEPKAYALFDAEDLEGVHREGTWVLEPGPAPSTLELRHRGRPAALVRIESELDPLTEALVRAIRAAGVRFVVAGRDGDVGVRLGADQVVGGGSRLAKAVRTLQEHGQVVALIAHRGGGAQAQADCGIGVLREGHRPPWRADLLCGPGLAEVEQLISALPEARAVSRRSAGLALGGSALAGVLGFIGPASKAGERVGLAVNGAALGSVVWGAWRGFEHSRRPAPLPAAGVPWHLLTTDRAVRALGSSRDGLPAGDVARRRPPGNNRRDSSAWMTFASALADELANPLTPILGVGAGLAAATGSILDAGLVAGVVGGSAVFSALHRLRATASLERLVRAGAVHASVRRGGRLTEVPSDQLVPGDVVVLGPGDRVPADLRVLETSAAQADESSLTGESMPVPKSTEPCPARFVGDRSCMLFEGTTLAEGTATGLVVAVGDATEMGRSLDAGEPAPPVGVEARLRSLTAAAVPVSLAGGLALLGSGLMHGRGLRESGASAMALAVAAVPEGLPFVAQAAAMASARRLSQRGALVRKAHTIEALGRVDVLCFDKTGTLTEGTLSVSLIGSGSSARALEDLGPHEREVLACALRASPDPHAGPVGHATDRAVIEAGTTAGVAPDLGAPQWRRRAELPFDPARGCHVVDGDAGGVRLTSVKGAPEVVLAACARWRTPDGPVVLGPELRSQLRRRVRQLAGKGYRVLAVAERTGESPAGDLALSDLDFLGFLALADHVRPSAAGAIQQLRQAGVSVHMITGDHPETARTIAAQLGILASDAADRDAADGARTVITGADLDRLDDEELDRVLPAVSVFARVAPAHKLRIVRSYQRLGHRVAMTGDGANDAPAIRRADVGIALGQRATASAREAADIVVTDDRVETIVDAIVEGRAMWASLRDALALLLGGNLGEIGFTVAASAVGGRSPLTSRQLLLVNLLTDLGPALALAVQRPHGVTPEHLVREGPDAALGAALARQVAVRATVTAGSAIGGWTVARCSGRRARASTVGLVALVGAQLGQTAVAGWRSPQVVVTTLASAAALGAVVQTPGVSQLFGCTPLGPVAWGTALGAAGAGTGASILVPALGSAARALRTRLQRAG